MFFVSLISSTLRKKTIPTYTFANKENESIWQLISFSKVVWKGCLSLWQVFISDISIAKAVAVSNLTTSEYKLKDVATFMKKVVLKAFESLKEISWTPAVDDIEKMLTGKLPEELERFLNLIFSGCEQNTKKYKQTKCFIC